MSDSSEYSISLRESKLSQENKHNSIFDRIFGLFRKRLLNGLRDERKRTRIDRYDSPRKSLHGSNEVNDSRVTKFLNSNRSKISAKRLQKNENGAGVKINQERFNIPIKPPVLKSLELSNIDIRTSNRNKIPHKVTYEGRIKPQIIQLGPRKAIRINPNSSTSTISLSPPGVLLSPPAIPLSPPSVSVSPLAVSLSPPGVESPPAIYESIHGSGVSPTQNIPISNTSTPYRSRSRMIKVNTIEDLDEPFAREDQKDNKEYIHNRSNSNANSEGENLNKELELASKKERKKKKKKSKDGQKRKRKREMLRDEANKNLRLSESNSNVVLTEGEGNDFINTPEVRMSSNLNNIHNPFHTITESSGNVVPNIIDSQKDIVNLLESASEVNRDQGGFSSNSKNGFITHGNTIHNLNIADDGSHKGQFATASETSSKIPNAALKEAGTMNKLFLSSDADSEEDKVILEYRNKRQYSELKWPGHDSIGDIPLLSEPETPKKQPSKGIDVFKNVDPSNKPRLLSDIMAERYKKDGISFLGRFKTPHLSFNDDESSNESTSIVENTGESPVLKKFGIDVRKERLRREGGFVANSNVN